MAHEERPPDQPNCRLKLEKPPSGLGDSLHDFYPCQETGPVARRSTAYVRGGVMFSRMMNEKNV